MTREELEKGIKELLSPQCHECRWFKDVGPGYAYRYTCNLPGSIIGSPIYDPYNRNCIFNSKREDQ